MILPSILLAVASVYTIPSGTTYTLQSNDPHINAETVVDVESGGVFNMNALSPSLVAVTGAGVVSNGTATLSLTNGPYRFSGRYYGTLKFAQGTTPDDQFGLVVGSKYTLDGATVWEPATAVHPLRFAKNVGRFRIGAILFETGPTLTTEDEAGVPVELVFAINNSSAAKSKVSGSGSLYLSSGGNLSSGMDLSGFTGTLGLWKGRLYQSGFEFPSTVRKIVVDRSFEPCTLASGDPITRFQFDNTQTPLYLTSDVFTTKDSGAGTYPMVDIDRPIDFLGRLRIAYLDIALGANCTNLTFRHGYVGCNSTGTTSAKNIDLKGDVELGSLTVNTWGNDGTQVKTIIPGGFAVSTSGSSIHVYRGAHYAHTMYRGVEKLYGHPGSTLTLGDRYGRKCSEGTELHLDGCTLRFLKYTYSFSQTPLNDENANLKVSVGANRVRVYTDLNWGNLYQYPWTIPATSPFVTETGLATDGGVEFYGGGRVHIRSPWTISGPFRITDGRVRFDSSSENLAATAPISGTGDFEIANGVIGTFDGGKLADSSRIVYEGAATIEMRPYYGSGTPTTPWTITIGRAGAAKNASLVRRGRGTLVFGDECAYHGFPTSYDTTYVKAYVNGGLTTQSNGRIPQPIFTAFEPTSQYTQLDFATIDAYNMIAPFTGYTDNDFTYGATAVVRVKTNMTLNYDATVAGLNILRANLTIADGQTLTVANAGYPGIVIGNNPGGSGYIYGANGTLAFGSSEGIVMVSMKGYSSQPFVIQPKITGSGGVTFAAARTGVSAGVRLTNANTYTGGTWINCVDAFVCNDNAFSTGDVHLGNGRLCGGRIRFDKANLTLANKVIGGGFGPYHNLTDTDGNSAMILFCYDNCTLAGPLELVDKARVRAIGNLTSTISGPISGARLQLWESTGTYRLTAENVHTGGTEVVRSTLAVTAPEAFGYGDVMLDGGTIRFENASPITVTNRIWGVGTIQLAGANVSFTGIDADPNIDALTLDVAGGSRSIDSITPFSLITNSVGVSGTLAVTGAGVSLFTGVLDPEVKLVPSADAVIDFGCSDIGTVEVGGAGAFRRVSMTIDSDIEPGGADAVGTLRIDPTPTFGPNACLVTDVTSNGVDKLVLGTDVDLSQLQLELRGNKYLRYADGNIVETDGTVENEFSYVTRPRDHWRLTYGSTFVHLAVRPLGLVIRVR